MAGRIKWMNEQRRRWGLCQIGIAVTTFLLTLVLFGWPLASRAQSTVATEPGAGTSRAPIPGGYRINPGDVVDVLVYDVPELSHSYTVSPSGAVTMPLLPGPVQAAGLTTDQFAKALEDAFRQSGRLRRPEIAVSIAKPSITSSVAVEGAVKSPLIVPEVGQVRLVDVITQCGGLSDDAGTTAMITRGTLALRELGARGEPANPVLGVDLKKMMDVGDPASRTLVWPGDRVAVERAQPEVYYVMGEVTRPGGYNLRSGREELTVLRAIALAGDETSVAKKSKAMIIRKDPRGPQGRDEIKLDLKKILLGKTPDPKLQADDILFVPGSNPKKALRTIEAAPNVIVGETGAAIILAR